MAATRLRAAAVERIRGGRATACPLLPEDHGEALIQASREVRKAPTAPLGTPGEGRPAALTVALGLQGARLDRAPPHLVVAAAAPADPKR